MDAEYGNRTSNGWRCPSAVGLSGSRHLIATEKLVQNVEIKPEGKFPKAYRVYAERFDFGIVDNFNELFYESSDGFAGNSLHNIFRLLETKYMNGNLIIHTKGGGSGIHYT